MPFECEHLRDPATCETCAAEADGSGNLVGLTVRVKPEQKAWLREKGPALDRSVSAVVRQLIARGMKAEAK